MSEHTSQHREGAPETETGVARVIRGITATNRKALFESMHDSLQALSAQRDARTARYTAWWKGVQALRADDTSRDGLIERTLREWIEQVRAGTRGRNDSQRARLETLFQEFLAEMIPSRPPFEERPRTSFTERRPE